MTIFESWVNESINDQIISCDDHNVYRKDRNYNTANGGGIVDYCKEHFTIVENLQDNIAMLVLKLKLINVRENNVLVHLNNSSLSSNLVSDSPN